MGVRLCWERPGPCPTEGAGGWQGVPGWQGAPARLRGVAAPGHPRGVGNRRRDCARSRDAGAETTELSGRFPGQRTPAAGAQPAVVPSRGRRPPGLGSHTLTPARARAPSPNSAMGRARGASSFLGKAPNRDSTSRERSSTEDRSPGGELAQESFAPPGRVASAAGAPRSLGAAWGRRTCLSRRLQLRCPEEQRGRSATRGGSCNSRGPAASPGAPPAQPRMPPPGPAPAEHSRSGGRAPGLRGKEAGARTALPGSLTLRPPGAWLPGFAPSGESPAGHGLQPRLGGSAARVPRGPHPLPTLSQGPCQHPEDERGGGAAPRDPGPGQGGQRGCPQHPWFPACCRQLSRPQSRPGLGSPTPEARGSRAMEGAPAPPAGSLPRRGRAELRAAAADLGRPRDAWRVPLQAELSGPSTHPHPTPLRTTARRCPGGSPFLPTAGGFAERGSLWMQRCSRRRRPGEPLRASARPGGYGGGPAVPAASERPGRRRQLTRSAPESESSTRSTPEPAVIFPPRRAPAPARSPAPGARSRPPPGSRSSDGRRRRCRRSIRPRASSPAAPPL